MATNAEMPVVRSYTCCGQHFTNLNVALDHFKQAHSVVDNQPLHLLAPSSGPNDDGVGSSPGSEPDLQKDLSSPKSSTTSSSGSGFGIPVSSTTSCAPLQPQSPLLSKPFSCPKPNCTKSYKHAYGLKNHMMYGFCRSAPSKTLEDLNDVLMRLGRTLAEPLNAFNDTCTDGVDTTQEQPPDSSLSISSTTSMSTSNFSEANLSEAERRLRPFACGVGDCPRRYKHMNGLKYHYQHSGAHGAAGMVSLESGQHDAVAGSNGVGKPENNQGVKADASQPLSHKGSGSILQSLTSQSSNIPGEPLSSSKLQFHHTFFPLNTSWSTPSSRSPVPDDNSPTVESVPNLFPPLKKRRLPCDDCRRRKIRCDMSLFECSQCQRSGLQCSFGQAERGRTRYRTRRTQSVPDPRKSDIVQPSQLTSFPPPLPFPAEKQSVKTGKISLGQIQSKPQRVQYKANNVSKTFRHGPEKFEYNYFVSESPPSVSSGVSRPRSLSFHRPTERDPNFGRPYSHSSSRPTSRPSSRPSSIHGSPVSTIGSWWKSLKLFQEDSVKEHATYPPEGAKTTSRLAIPLPTPPIGNGRLRQSVNTTHRRRRRRRRYSRAASPHPSRPSSRTSFTLPLERRSSYSRPSPGPVSGSSSHPSSRPSSRTSYYSPTTSHKSWFQF